MDEFNDLKGGEMDANEVGSPKSLEMALEAEEDWNKLDLGDWKKVEVVAQEKKAGQMLHKVSVDLGARSDSGLGAEEFGAKLSEQEMIGVDEGHYDNG
ncbi:hypothetical protein DITRI_Ditri09bG0113200 [Diplodiscus trichospermus]